MLSPLARRAIKSTRLLTFAAGRQGLRHGVAAAIEHWRALSALDVKTVVGANKGQFAFLTTRVFPDATIYSLEPLQEPAARFRETAIGPSETEAPSTSRSGVIPHLHCLLPSRVKFTRVQSLRKKGLFEGMGR